MKDDILEHPYTITYYTVDNSFVVSRQYHEGKNEKGVDSYGRVIIYDGRSQAMKGRVATKNRVIIPTLNKKDVDFALGESDGTPEGDEMAMRYGLFYFIFEEPERLGIV